MCETDDEAGAAAARRGGDTLNDASRLCMG
jgi:hypothetical protein